MSILELVKQARSYRRFDESVPIPPDVVHQLVDAARLSPSARNAQPLKYLVSTNKEMNERVFSTLSWAGSLKEWDGPKPGERPTAYIIVLLDSSISANAGVDPGIVGQTIQLGATEAGYGACMLGAINRGKLAPIIELPDGFSIEMVIALGKPAEKIVLEDPRFDGSVVYYRDETDAHHVPKRRLDEVLIRAWQ
ncbi:MAG: nitroreductase [Spirochaetaceae bacterium]|nr:MAG: nitroreductase [Spirochaetaceae bacterium]